MSEQKLTRKAFMNLWNLIIFDKLFREQYIIFLLSLSVSYQYIKTVKYSTSERLYYKNILE